MSANSKTSDSVQDHKGTFSLRERLAAWWDGTDLLDMPAGSASAAESAGESEAGSAAEEKEGPVRYEPAKQRWETSRLSLVQKVWGDGFTSPGGRKHTLDMVTSFGLDPAMSVLDLGTGLGGSARAMCEKFGVWVTGFEVDADLAEAGMALSVKAGMSEKAQVLAFDPATFEHKQASVDCVFSKEFLYAVADKDKFLKAVEDLLKSKGQFMFTDFMLTEPHLHTPAITNWIEKEPLTPKPWALEDYEVGLVGARLDIRVTEDITDVFRAMVIKGWANYTENAEPGSVGMESAPALVDEVELWTRRIQAIDSGDLKVYRIHAFKKEPSLGMSH
jgi:SAM-dependent methyltransferase